MSGPSAPLRLVTDLLRPLRGRLLAAVLATVVTTAAALVPPYLAGLVINNVIDTGSSSDLIWISIALVAALAINAVASGLESWLTGDVGQRALMDLRRRIVTKLHELPMSYYDRASTGSTVSRVTNDVEALNVLVSGGLNQLVSGLLIVLGTAAVMVVLDWRLAIVALFVFPFLITVSAEVQRHSRPAWRRASESFGDVTSYVQEGLAGRDVVRGFGQEDRHVLGFDEVNAQNEEIHYHPISLNRVMAPSAEVIGLLGVAAVIAYGAHEVIGGALAVGTVVTFLGYLRQALAPLPQLATLFSSFQQGLSAIESISVLLEHDPDPGREAGRKHCPPIRGTVTLERVTFGYEPDKQVLRDLDLQVEEGESLAIVGGSGSGKSTIVKLLVGFYAPQTGRVLIDGNDLGELDLGSVRKQIGYVPQEPFLFTGTVADNIVWDEESSGDRARGAAEAVGAIEALQRLPAGLDSQVGERGGLLSIGQRQLVALARATAIDPRILVLDEATSNIDTATEAAVQRGIDLLLEGRTSIVVAHRLSTIRRSDKIVVLDKGRVVEFGSPAELRAADGPFAALDRQYDG
jgi:ATP-binding cassette subfamily B protein